MATCKCRECGQEVAESAQSCPHCGATMPATSREVYEEGQEMWTNLRNSLMFFAALYFVARWTGFI